MYIHILHTGVLKFKNKFGILRVNLLSAETLFVKYTQWFVWPEMKQVKQVKKI
jgi:hypothetical protein